MSVFVRHDTATGDIANEGYFDSLDQRIDDAFAAHEATLAGMQSTLDGLDDGAGNGSVPDLQKAVNRLSASPSTITDAYTLQTQDVGTLVSTLINGNAKTFTVPNSITVAGELIFIDNNGTGTLTFALGSGTTAIRSRGGILTSTQQWARMVLRKESSGVYKLSGEIG